MDKRLIKKIFDGIIITHFVNPHMFWFRPETTYSACYDFLEFDNKLNLYFEKQKFNSTKNSGHTPVPNEIVAVYIPCWAKWIRGKVDAILDVVNDDKKIIIWALDLGFPLQSKEKHIKPLPKELQLQNFNLYYFAGVSYVMPCEKRYNFLKMDTELIELNDWGSNAVREFENFILKSSKITFYAEFEYRHQFFGRLEFTTNEGFVLDMANVLFQLDIALKSYIRFIEDLNKHSTVKLKRYALNDGTISISKLRYDKFSEHNFKHPMTNDESNLKLPSLGVTKKVLDWAEQNEKILQDEAKDEIPVQEIDSFDSVSYFDQDTNKFLMPGVNGINQTESKNVQKSDYEIDMNSKTKNLKGNYLMRESAIHKRLIQKSIMDEKPDINVETEINKNFFLKNDEIADISKTITKTLAHVNLQDNCSNFATDHSTTNDKLMSKMQRDTILKNKCKEKLARKKKQFEFLSTTKASITNSSLLTNELNDNDEDLEQRRLQKRKALILKLSKRTPVLSVPAGFDLGRLEDVIEK